MSEFSHSRSMPPRHEWALHGLRAGRKVFDGRQRHIVDALLTYEWAIVVDRDPKNERKVTLAITERGDTALERSKRGVDPYLRMTG